MTTVTVCRYECSWGRLSHTFERMRFSVVGDAKVIETPLEIAQAENIRPAAGKARPLTRIPGRPESPKLTKKEPVTFYVLCSIENAQLQSQSQPQAQRSKLTRSQRSQHKPQRNTITTGATSTKPRTTCHQ